jgi:hypothetical protein
MSKVIVDEKVMEFLIHIAEEHHQEVLGYHCYENSDTKLSLEIMRKKYLTLDK